MDLKNYKLLSHYILVLEYDFSMTFKISLHSLQNESKNKNKQSENLHVYIIFVRRKVQKIKTTHHHTALICEQNHFIHFPFEHYNGRKDQIT